MVYRPFHPCFYHLGSALSLRWHYPTPASLYSREWGKVGEGGGGDSNLGTLAPRNNSLPLDNKPPPIDRYTPPIRATLSAREVPGFVPESSRNLLPSVIAGLTKLSTKEKRSVDKSVIKSLQSFLLSVLLVRLASYILALLVRNANRERIRK